MNKLLVFFASCIVLGTAFHSIQYEFGVDTSIHWAEVPYHILHEGSAVPRHVLTEIKFKQAFQSPPQVVLGAAQLDWQDKQPAGFDVYVHHVTPQGFTLKYTAVSPKMLFGLNINWAAIYDPNIVVVEYNTKKVDDLASGENKLRTKYVDIPFGRKFDETPNVALFLTGVQFTQRNNVLFTKVQEVKKNKVVVQAYTWWTTQVQYFRVNMIIGSPSILYTGSWEFRVPDYSHPMAKSQPVSDRNVEVSSEITDLKFQKQDAAMLWGFKGFDQDDWYYQRTYIDNVQLKKTSASASVGTWWDSVLYQFDATYFLYKPDIKEKLFEEGCAEIFTECGYQGDSMSICDKVLSFPEDGWNKPIKSFRIPEGKVLKVYNKENLKGLSIKIEENTECLEQVRFTFAELMSSILE